MITRFYVTTRGKKLYAKWQTGAIPAFTRIQVGKGTIPDGISPESVTALYDAVKFIPISGESISGSTANIAAQFSNEGVITAFDWKEIGLFATDPNDGEILYGYGYDLINPTNIPSYATSPVSFIYTMQLAIGNATEITIVVDPATAYATKAELSEALSGKAAVSHAHAQADVTGLTTALAGKADKVTGKTLSTNDLTDALKTNYDKAHTHALAAHAPADANNYAHPIYPAAAAALVKVGRDALGHMIPGAAVVKADITALGIPAQDTVYVHPNSDATAGTYRSVTVNAQGHVTAGSNPISTIAQGGTGATTADAARVNLGAAAVSHVHTQSDVTGLTTALAGKADKVTGKTLSTNDLTDALKTNYDKAHTHALAAHAPADANNYAHPIYPAAAAALVKVGRDALGHMIPGAAVVKADITALGIPAQDTVYVHPNSDATAGTYRSVTVNAQGHVTAGSNPISTIAQGGTGATTADAARANLGAAAVSHIHAQSDVTGLSTALAGKATAAQGMKADSAVQTAKIGDAVVTKSGTELQFPEYPMTLPASDVSPWAKAATKPSYTKAEVGLGSVDNTADGAKSVAQAAKLTTERTINGVIFDGSANITIADNTKIPTSQKGAPSGVAELDANGKVLSAQLPSYVDDVLEYASLAYFPATGESGKIYVATNTNLTYRWSGSTYTEISSSIALGETSSTAYRGDRGKAAYDHSQTSHAPSNAERNVITTIKRNGAALNPDVNRSLNIAVPTNVSDLINDSGYLSVHQDISGKVDKVTGKGLSQNDLTTALKGNYDSAYTHAQAPHAPTTQATPAAPGIMSAADKAKLDGVTAGATRNGVLDFAATIGTTWAGASAPYTQDVAVAGLLDTDAPIVDMVASALYATAEKEIDAWAVVYRIATAAGKIKVWASDKTTQAVSVRLRVVR